VLEKSWLLSGRLASRLAKRGTTAAVVENLVRTFAGPVRGPGDLARWAEHRVVRSLVGRYLRRAPLVIAETDDLAAALVRRFSLAPERVVVVGLGIDRERFAPRELEAARAELGLSTAVRVLLYAGVLDRTHDLRPAVEGLARATGSGAGQPIELHVLGDGVLRADLERAAAGLGAHAVFHGRVPPEQVPAWIGAAELCLAPYDVRAFPGGRVAYSTLKIPEAMACARAVASVPSGRVLELVAPDVTGFLLPNLPDTWAALFRELPTRARLLEMGRAAAASPKLVTWDETARAYLAACERSVRP
jgi:glycosyltransferase involved in cell wall biosynthesis